MRLFFPKCMTVLLEIKKKRLFFYLENQYGNVTIAAAKGQSSIFHRLGSTESMNGIVYFVLCILITGEI